VTTKNVDSTVMNEPCAYRVLGMLPVYKTDATPMMTAQKRSDRRHKLFHDCVREIVQKLNAFCSEVHDVLYADGKVRRTRPFLHFFIMDGLEIALNTLCPIRSCPSCWCDDSQLDNTEVI
jgi:hypothetical protein